MITLGFNACTPKTELVFVEEARYPFKVVAMPEDRKWLIHKSEAEAFKAWKDELYFSIKYMNRQVEMYLEKDNK